MAESEDAEQEIRRALEVVQSMIDISADRLEGLRTQCSTSAELTQQEIRTLEGKLIKLYSKQLVTKEKLAIESLPVEMRQYPSLQQWLRVVGLTPESIQLVCSKASSLESLKEKSEHELGSILGESNMRHEEELRRLCRALHNLRRYMDVLVRGDMENNDMNLYWDSWDRHHVRSGASPRPIRSRITRSSVPSEDSIPYHNNNNFNSEILAQASSVVSLSSSTSPPSTPLLLKGQALGLKFSTTPPPCKKNQSGSDNPLQPEVFPLTKSKSHESQLANRLEKGEITPSTTTEQQVTSVSRRSRLPTEPGSYSGADNIGDNLVPTNNSPVKSPPYSSAESDDNSFKGTVTSLQVPKSPRTPTVTRGMGHVINHRFTKTFKMMTTCDYCDKQMFIGTGLKCKECKYKCHRDCESKVPPSCGLPQELFDEFKRTLQADSMVNASPILNKPGIMSPNHHNSNLLASLNRRDRKRSHPHPSMNIAFQKRRNASSSFQIHFWHTKYTCRYQGADSSSNTSSCNSSTPSSPALIPVNVGQIPQVPVKQQFHFPDIAPNDKGVTLETHRLEGTVSSDSDRTVSVSGSGSVSTDSERTPVRVDSQDSQVSDGEPGDSRWPRQNSLSMREWDIPYDELKIGEPIGTGRFGTVYRGNWHGDVAIKVLNMDYYLDDDKTLEAFKLEVATFRKTRHENLVLFMGACMKPPRLAIVTSMSKGMTLYTHIHLRKDKFNMNKTTIIAQQISQGMGYLHARGIVHKDLKSKNIFLENGKVVITDFGLFSVTKLCYGNRTGNGLSIPPGWLCYLAPEIVRRLRPRHNRDQEELPFTDSSDVYAFGTVWYELLCGEWPFKGQPPEAIIWQVGKGMKQTLANLQASRDVKDILMLCWSYHPENRPDFAKLLTTLEKLPRKRLARSPSHPIHLSRSAESVF
ncbi:PREDICTED: kinase suppressor of Ras 2 [Ceratosolen solmsi marchali]|uniref:Kinase suppressor of Ras 2 n=1 Tax=Ceratosolen solmsi marchali TaxID=326594 RepID=A0AAJ6YLY8_9HYME|nr:PREDICTED: kinase suppressor of Ras 2 [Ceratosolen solmsi marchali]